MMEKIFKTDRINKSQESGKIVKTAYIIYVSDIRKIEDEIIGYLKNDKISLSVGEVIDNCVKDCTSIEVGEELNETTQLKSMDITQETFDFIKEKKEHFNKAADFFHQLLKHTKYG